MQQNPIVLYKATPKVSFLLGLLGKCDGKNKERGQKIFCCDICRLCDKLAQIYKCMIIQTAWGVPRSHLLITEAINRPYLVMNYDTLMDFVLGFLSYS